MKSIGLVLLFILIAGGAYWAARYFALYFSTSNRDGRGKPRTGDDKIYRLVRDQ